MSENLRAYTRALYALDAAAARVTDWDAPTPCTQWSAREVLGHVTWGTRALVATVGDGDMPVEQPEAEVAGDDPYATFVDARTQALEALDHQGVLQSVRTTPFGEMSVDDFLGIYHFDPLLHAWDIAQACGQPHGIDAAAAERAHTVIAPVIDNVRGGGRFDEAKDAPADADAIGRLAAFSGRDV